MHINGQQVNTMKGNTMKAEGGKVMDNTPRPFRFLGSTFKQVNKGGCTMKAAVTKNLDVTIRDNEDNIMLTVFTEDNGEYTIYLDYAYKIVESCSRSIVITKDC